MKITLIISTYRKQTCYFIEFLRFVYLMITKIFTWYTHTHTHLYPDRFTRHVNSLRPRKRSGENPSGWVYCASRVPANRQSVLCLPKACVTSHIDVLLFARDERGTMQKRGERVCIR